MILGKFFYTGTFLWEIYIHNYSKDNMEDTFYLTVSIIAAVILILSLTYVGVLLYSTKSTDAFPPTQSKCPDYWEIDISGKCKVPSGSDKKNAGSLNYKGSAPTNQIDTAGTYASDINSVITNSGSSDSLMDVSDASWNGLKINGSNTGSALCNKARWARFANVVWDGVSNTNQC